MPVNGNTLPSGPVIAAVMVVPCETVIPVHKHATSNARQKSKLVEDVTWWDQESKGHVRLRIGASKHRLR